MDNQFKLILTTILKNDSFKNNIIVINNDDKI